MNHQLSYEVAQSRNQDMLRAAERSRLAADAQGRQPGQPPSLRFTIRTLAPRTARALVARVRVA
jgi:hypothetical protein